MQKKEIVFSSLLTIASLCFALVVAELFLANLSAIKKPEVLRKQSLEYGPSPIAKNIFPNRKQVKVHNNRSYEINSLGYRGKEFSPKKRAGSFRIFILGGSSVFDAKNDQKDAWPFLLEKQLQGQGYKNVEVINAGIPGHKTWQSLSRIYSEIWQYEPDMIVLYQAWNDIKYFRWLNPQKTLLREDYFPYARKENSDIYLDNPFIFYRNSVDKFLSRFHSYLLARTYYFKWKIGDIALEGAIPKQVAKKRKKKSIENLLKHGGKQYQLNISLIAEAAKSIGAKMVFMQQARLATATNTEKEKKKIKFKYVLLSHEDLLHAYAQCEDAIETVGASKNVPIFRTKNMNGNLKYFYDQVHTTKLGSQELAKQFSRWLIEQRLLRKTRYISLR